MEKDNQVFPPFKDFVEATTEAGESVMNTEANRTTPHATKETKETTSETLAQLAKQNVAPFLTKYHPRQYAPLRSEDGTPSIPRSVNAGYCYRHQPDSKCNRQADEKSMRQLQQVSSGFFSLFSTHLLTQPGAGDSTPG